MIIYPAVFITEEIGGYSVLFPDFPGCQTQGDDMAEALEMANEVLGVFIAALEEDNIPVPPPSAPQTIQLNPGEFISLVSTDVSKYYRNKSVKKTLTIPKWLNEQAIHANVNFSQVLQTALKEQLQSVR
jgi:predicted RNase H-like HicB family nuclease